MSNIIQKTLNFSALACGNEANSNFQQMSIAYSIHSIPEHVNSAIGEVNASSSLSDKEKQRQIAEKLLNETNCHVGYFFDNVPNMNFKNLYLETCNETLETYILKYATKIDFQWTILQKICVELVDSVAWLHRRDFYYDGRLHPRNIFMKTSDTPWKVKLQVSEKPNPFHNLDTEYVNLWSGIKKSDVNKSIDEKAIQRDLVSLAILIFFIQSVGFHPFKIKGHKAQPERYRGAQEQLTLMGKFSLVALDRKCFCVEKENCKLLQCKYRYWVNMLAKDHTQTLLKELCGKTSYTYTKESSGKLMEHPFFWKTSGVLRFIEESSNYLNDKDGKLKNSLFAGSVPEEQNMDTTDSSDEEIPNHTPWLLSSALLSELRKNHKEIFDYLCQKRHNQIQINNFGDLLTQIRNKSAHWNEPSECEKKAKDELKKISFEADSEMDAKHKFCLFWNIHFPELILYTWKIMKDVVPHQQTC